MKKRPWLYVLGAVVLIAAVGFGALGGAAVTYYVTQVRPVRAAVGLAQTPAASDGGLLIADVAADSAAAAAGLVRGDILLEVNGTTVNTLSDLQAVLSDLQPGDAVTLRVQHGDAVRETEATLADQDGEAYLGIGTCGCGYGDYGPGKGGMWYGDSDSDTPMHDFLAMGAEVVEVVAGSPAEQAGLVVGDVIVAVDGEDIGPAAGLSALVQAKQPGDELVLSVVSADAEDPHDVTVKLGENPDAEGQAYLGIRYAPSASMGDFEGQLPEGINPEDLFRNMPGMPGMPGLRGLPGVELPEGVDSAAIIGDVTSGSPADDAGLVAGDVVLAVDDEPVEGPDALVAAVGQHKPGDQISLTLYRDGAETSVKVTLGENPDNAGAAYLGVMVTGFIRTERSGQPGGRFNFGDGFDGLNLPNLRGQDA